MPVPPPRQPFRWLPEGKGGTFAVDASSKYPVEHLTYFGTYDCHTCVGVWWPIDGQRCFLAHINCSLIDIWGAVSWVVRSGEEAARIKGAVRKLLDEERKQADWGEISAEGKRGVVLVCPKMSTGASDERAERGGERTCVGYFVVEAIREWLGVSEVKVDTQHCGFVVKHPDGSVALLSRDDVEGIKGGLLQPQVWKRWEEKGPNVSSWTMVLPRS
ncbi:hypothetical protein B0A55_09871 [Friedmanniomyces simplex]|uniref:Uncharacterized protein n=1 Tax=Friedmanniomyces simplex TaxID=329884 RepID=A0A4U0WKS3_9PEZI|nr:hypothetical protein B0A55_09871 [Friedmanniomyces simplex]